MVRDGSTPDGPGGPVRIRVRPLRCPELLGAPCGRRARGLPLTKKGKGGIAMGRATFRIRVRTAAEGLKERFSVSPDIWDEPEDTGHNWVAEPDDVSDWLDLPPGFRAPDDDEAAYRRSSSSYDLSLADDELDEAWSSYGLATGIPRLVHPHVD
jgi:hypothetical protein